MHKTRITIVLTLALSISGCDSQEWQPYIDKYGKFSFMATVTFPTLIECQQYLHIRFGNTNEIGDLMCASGCSETQREPMPSEFRLGHLVCPSEGRQIVGNLIPLHEQLKPPLPQRP
jgi:hypothetical protein